VGLSLALDLSWRGVPCTVVEKGDGTAVNPRANVIAARSMEHFRRLGLADEIRRTGLPGDYPADVVACTRFLGDELSRDVWPTSEQVLCGQYDETEWPTAEPPHRANQMFLNPVLFERARSEPLIDMRVYTEMVSFSQDERAAHVDVVARDGTHETLTCSYLVGCDGVHSLVRKGIDAALDGVPEISKFVTVAFDSAELQRLNTRPAWAWTCYNPDAPWAVLFSIDGRRRWTNHRMFGVDEDTSAVDPRELVTASVGREVAIDSLRVLRWTARALVARRFRAGRVFLAGDAAHQWVPTAGFGMNSGIQEAMELGWMLSAVLHGWGGANLLDAYEIERKPIGEQVAAAAARIARAVGPGSPARRAVDAAMPNVERSDAAGEAARGIAADFAREVDLPQHRPLGLNFGYSYGGSPIIVSDGSPCPPFSLTEFCPEARPGLRLPHFRLASGRPIHDELGPDFTLLRVGGSSADIRGLSEAAGRRRVPLRVLDVAEPSAATLCGAELLLVRPDQHVAWRGNEPPRDPLALIDRVRGA
jgi:2-polyprenyl-6-methoxyphenol hydroxylase-like FAD-dependent oxidoreductase